MKTDCPPKLVIERFFFEGKGDDGVKNHVEECPSCRGKLLLLQKDREDFLKKYPFELLWKKIGFRREKGRFWERWFLPVPLRAGLALATISGLMILALWQQGRLPEILSKGGVGLNLTVAHEGVSTRGTDGMSLAPGDHLQFVYSTGQERFLLLFGIEANRTLTVYYPYGGSSSAPVSPGKDKPLPHAIQWRPSSPYERFVALFSEEPISLREVEEALGKTFEERKSVEKLKRFPLPYRQVSILLYRKN